MELAAHGGKFRHLYIETGPETETVSEQPY
jgi:hypothetical protein